MAVGGSAEKRGQGGAVSTSDSTQRKRVGRKGLGGKTTKAIWE